VRIMAVGRRNSAFTLIELLVVVAIIALLISILLPSLSRAREQARTTMCLTRIGQLGTAFLTYAEDYDEVFPFTATLQETYSQGPDPNETWLANWLEQPDPAAAINIVAYKPQEEWGALTEVVPRSGILFFYARFETLYRCPEFERIDHPYKGQNVFNYTRPLWGRQYRLKQDYQVVGKSSPFSWGGVDGPILKVANVHNPAELPLALDEQWNRFVGDPLAGIQKNYNGSAYNCQEYGFYIDNTIAASHGRPVKCRLHSYDDGPESYGVAQGYDPYLWKRGGVVCYDGHAQLLREVWPTLELGNNKRHGPWRVQASSGARMLDELSALMEYTKWILYAQRGFDTKERYGKPPPVW